MLLNDFLSGFKCQQCGKCCRELKGTAIIEPELPLLNHLAKRLQFKPVELVIIDVKQYLKQPCQFISYENKCLIYHNRPASCQLFPFKLDKITGDLRLSVFSFCEPGVKYFKEKNNG
jgi:Fe-S-cluster containining protein